jgi:hypothetical protein
MLPRVLQRGGRRKRGKILMKRILLLILLAGISSGARAAVMQGSQGGWQLGKPAVLPNTQLRVHDVGKIWLSVTNFGFFGSQDGTFKDAAGIHTVAPGCEFPGGSSLNYLFQGALWVGATKDTVINGHSTLDTLVSIGNDGWWGQLFEMFPAIPPGGDIKVRSTRPSNVYPFGDTAGAKSEQDFIAVYSDTITNSSLVPEDPNDGRPHIPLHIQITQRSYAWSYEYAEDFVLFDFDINNIGNDTLKNVWIGLYIDSDVYHTSENPYGVEQGAQDDIAGFDSIFVQIDGRDTTRSRINTAWIADNDGQPYPLDVGTYDYRSPRGVSGVRVVRTPLPDSQLHDGFNWWISNTTASLDWGPRKMYPPDSSYLDQPFPGGGMGTPGGDRAKYQVMSNHEFDYDQIWCNLPDASHSGWIPKPTSAADLANGYDTRYLFSFGPFPVIAPRDTLKLTTAYVAGENLHRDPQNYFNNLKTHTDDSAHVATYYANLDFSDFATNSQWADWVYDNPGVDTDGDGYRGLYRITASGDTFWYKGDGVPDFAGPPPSPAPKLDIVTDMNSVTLNWDGKYTENFKDNFSGKKDFEGYRIYKSPTGRSDDWTLVGDYDVIDFDYAWIDSTTTPPSWTKWKKSPVKLISFICAGLDTANMESFDTTSITPGKEASIDQIPRTDSCGGFVDISQLGGLPAHAYWMPHGWNTGFAHVQPDPAVNVADTTYSFTMSGLPASDGIYFTVTAYDYGNPVTKLSSLESSTSIAARLVYPIGKAGVNAAKVAVYPNPYRLRDALAPGGYLDRGREDVDRSGNTNFDRRIWFAGLPDNWVIRIFTLDGDLVKQINKGDAPYTQPSPSDDVAFWDLISRNTQAVVSGVYIYSIEGVNGYHQLGKIAIIK